MRRLLVCGAVLLAACGGQAPPPPTPTSGIGGASTETKPSALDAAYRKSAPAPDGDVTFTAPKVRELALKNGLRVLLVERHEVPVVGVRFVVPAGAGDLASARPGLVSFVGGMLELGTKKRSALQVSDDYEAIGASHGAWFDWDSGGVSLKVLSDQLDEGLAILADVALSPTFPQAEVDRLRARRVAAVAAEKSSPGAAAQNNVAAALFGRAHAYGHSLSGREADAKKITRAEVVAAYDKLLAQGAALVVAGDVTPEALLPKLEATFGTWKRTASASAPKGPKTDDKAKASKRIVLVDRKGAQSQVQLVKIGVAHGHADRDAIGVMNAILGGMFSSRINLNLREKHAYTYGARSYFVMRHGAGPFSAGASVFADKTVPAIKELLTEIEGLRSSGPTEDELTLAKESMLLAMPGRFETVADVATAISDLVVYDLPLDFYEQRPARIRAVTAADVQRVAKEQLAPDTLTLVVVGDKERLATELATLGLGDFEERDPYGDPVPAGATDKPKATTTR